MDNVPHREAATTNHKLNPMHESREHLQTLTDIRSLMERSAKFLSLSGLSGVSAGVIALAGAALSSQLLRTNPSVRTEVAIATVLRYRRKCRAPPYRDASAERKGARPQHVRTPSKLKTCACWEPPPRPTVG